MIRFLDLVFSALAILLLTPFMIPIMIGLLLTGEHHVFYLQPRIGKNGKAFNVLKFATMLKNSPNMTGGFITQKDDPRILPMGNFLRKTKINELPQLINVFLGQMSFVGPRPMVKSHLDLYPPEAKETILGLVPGLTGLGSLVFRDEEEVLNRAAEDRKHFHDNVIAPYKAQLEVWYAENRSLGTYFAIVFLTAWSVLNPASTLFVKAFKGMPPPPKALKEALRME